MIRDYRHYAHQREVAARRHGQDARDAERHRQFDLAAQDTRMKYERFHFAVVTASDAFRRGYDEIAWGSACDESRPPLS